MKNEKEVKEEASATMTPEGLVIIKGDITKKIKDSEKDATFTFSEALAEMN